MQGLLCRAKSIDNGELIEGYCGLDYNEHGISYGENGVLWAKIDPQTLQYQILDKWYSKTEIEAIMAKEL